jgi:hypothetical protein
MMGSYGCDWLSTLSPIAGVMVGGSKFTAAWHPTKWPGYLFEAAPLRASIAYVLCQHIRKPLCVVCFDAQAAVLGSIPDWITLHNDFASVLVLVIVAIEG